MSAFKTLSVLKLAFAECAILDMTNIIEKTWEEVDKK